MGRVHAHTRTLLPLAHMVRCILRVRRRGGGGFIQYVYIRWLQTRSGPHSDPGPDDDDDGGGDYLASFGRALRETTHLEERVSALPRRRIDIYNIILYYSLHTSTRSNRRRRSHVPNTGPSASKNGSDAEGPRQRQRKFLHQPSQPPETSVETVPRQQRQLSAADHQVG